ncbi:MAG TPA: hypothetical protein PK344_06475 [Syntrophorhabdaceae bacterium]|nr:hypothetical protein [Syntrophorhabdaceae bacterium]
MYGKRFFTDDELREMDTPLVDRIETAVNDGRYEEAKGLSRQLEQECFGLIYSFEEFVTSLLSYIYEKHGNRDIEEALRYTANVVLKPGYEVLAKLEFRQMVQAWAAIFRVQSGHGMRMEEDDEKVTFILDPCGSGGRMEQGGFCGPPRNLIKIKKAQNITFYRENFPSYCTHCAVFHNLMPIVWGGAPLPSIELGSGPGNPCKFHIYKDTSAIPAHYYEQVGQSKPMMKN